MTRSNVKLAFILNNSARRATFNKRKKSLIKKLEELTTLCGINACAIIYSPFESLPELWPHKSGVENAAVHLRNMSEIDKTKRMVNQESFVRQQINKVDEQIKRTCSLNREMEITHALSQVLLGKGFGYLNENDLNDLGWLTDEKLKEINNRKIELRKDISSNSIVMPSQVNNDGLIVSAQHEEGLQVIETTFGPNAAQTHGTADNMVGHQHLGAAAGEEIPPLDSNNDEANLWMNGYFPWEN